MLNEGLLSPGGPGVIQTTELHGDYVQTSSGKYAVDIDQGGGTSDLLNVNAGPNNDGTAEVDGKVKPDIIANPETGTQTVTILTADGGVTNNGLRVRDTALVDYSLLFNPNDIQLRMNVDFGSSGVGKQLNEVFEGGGPDGLEDLALALLRLESNKDVSDAFQQLLGEDYRSLGIAEFYAQERFKEDMISCPIGGGAAVVGPVAEPLKVGTAYPNMPVAYPGSSLDENPCIWARIKWRNLEVDANEGTSGFDEDAVGVAGGGQFAFNGPWFGGVTFGYENSDIDGNPVFSEGDRFQVGGTLKYITGPWLVAGCGHGRLERLSTPRARSPSPAFPASPPPSRSSATSVGICGWPIRATGRGTGSP